MSKALIVGGGIIGLASAYYLDRAGWTVEVIDRGRIGGACSHGNCGYLCPSHVLPLAAPGALGNTLKTLFTKNSPLKVRPGAVLQNLAWFTRFAVRCNSKDMLSAGVGIQALLNSSRSLIEDMVIGNRFDVEWDANGLLFVFHSKAAFEHYAEMDHLLSDRFQMPAKKWDADELNANEPALIPGSASGAYHYESDAQIRPDRLVAELRKLLDQRGVKLVENSELNEFRVENGKVKSAITSHGEHLADGFVVATGASTPLLKAQLGYRAPIVPGKGYSITMPRPTLCPKYPMIFEEHRVAISPFRTGFRIGSTMEFAGYDETMNRDRLKLLGDGAAVYLKEPGDPATATEEWWGWRPMTADGLPIIDRLPKLPNAIVAAGHGMLGLSMAAGTGKLVAELLSGTTPHLDPAPYRLNRA